MPELPDLPPELFQDIVHWMNKTSPASTWELRGVCRTFAAEIEHDLFTNQPTDTFTTMGKAIKFVMARLFLAHLKKFSSTNDRVLGGVLTMLRRMTDYLCWELSIPEVDRENMEKQLVEGSTQAFSASHLFNVIWGSGPRCYDYIEEDFGDQGPVALEDWAKVAAAIAVLHYDLLESLLSLISHEYLDVCLARSYTPLVIAIKLGDDRLFDIVMGYLNGLSKTAKRRAAEVWNFNLDSAMYRAIRANEARFVEELVQFLETMVRRVEKRTYNEYLRTAIKNSNTATTKSILRLS